MRVFSKSEVAALLHIQERTLTNYGARYPVYKADNAGVYHEIHVRILEKVRTRILTPEEGLALWRYEKIRLREKALQDLPMVCVKASRKSRKGN